jgi:hypothetical protein
MVRLEVGNRAKVPPELLAVRLPVAGNAIVLGHQQQHHILKSREPFLNGEALTRLLDNLDCRTGTLGFDHGYAIFQSNSYALNRLALWPSLFYGLGYCTFPMRCQNIGHCREKTWRGHAAGMDRNITVACAVARFAWQGAGTWWRGRRQGSGRQNPGCFRF